MADPYSPCICGCGRKFKQCAPRAVINELDRIERAIDGHQRMAALDHIARLEKAHGALPVLLTLRAQIQLELGESEDAEATLKQFAELAPNSCVMLALRSMTHVINHDTDAALDDLLASIEACPALDYEYQSHACYVVAQVLAGDGNFSAVRLLLTLISSEDSPDPIKHMLINVVSEEANQHGLLSEAGQFELPEPERPLAKELLEAARIFESGLWRKALRRQQEIVDGAPDNPLALKHLAVMQFILNQQEQSAESWRRLMELESASEEERIVAAGVLSIIIPSGDDWYLDVTELTYEVDDLDPVLERMAQNDRLLARPAEEVAEADAGGPPPRAAFQLLDRSALPLDCQQAELEDVPEALGNIVVYGKRTDAPAQVVLIANDETEPACLELLREACPELDGEPRREKLGEIHMRSVKLGHELALPREMPQAERKKIREAAMRRMLLQVWPRTPHPVLDGLTPAVAARDRTRRIPVEGLLLAQQLRPGGIDIYEPEAYEQLRRQLGLTVEPLKPEAIDAGGRIPLPWLVRLPLSDLDDRQLATCLKEARPLSMGPAALIVAEALQRLALRSDPSLGLATCCQVLARHTMSPHSIVLWLERAEELLSEQGESPAGCRLNKFAPLLMMGESQRARETFEQLTTLHINEPGVREALTELIQRLGLDSAAAGAAAPGAAAPAPEAEPASAPSGSPIWTPDGGGSSSGEGKKLWLPGQD